MSDSKLVTVASEVPGPTLEEYYEIVRMARRVVSRYSPELRAAIQEGFKRAEDQARAVIEGRLDPLSA